MVEPRRLRATAILFPPVTTKRHQPLAGFAAKMLSKLIPAHARQSDVAQDYVRMKLASNNA
jgi:hypothetical protein